ncbi:MAG: hypothetical protein ACW99A_02870 [Candidatus Kariarchaeaceae archaeon]|jgi:ABC-type dipeptide/oligopeptide/nickel transport system ATPase component
MPFAYYWDRKVRKRIPWGDAETLPEIKLYPLAKRFRYSSANINYNPQKYDLRDRIPYLFDGFEVAAGHYLVPRTYKGKIVHPKMWGAPINILGSNVSGCWGFHYTTAKYNDYYFTKITKDANMDSWIHYPEDQCPITLIIGRSGSGKSVLINYLMNLCLGNNEAAVMAADEYCDWRSLLQSGKIVHYPPDDPLIYKDYYFHMGVELHPIEIWHHKDSDINYVKKIERPNLEYKTFTTAKEIKNGMETGKLIAIYDADFDEDEKPFFWSELAELVNLRSENYTAVFAHHEIGDLLPQHPSTKDEWKGLQEFAKQIRSFRKNDTRFMSASQLFSEVYYRLSKKSMYIFWKQNDKNDYIRDGAKRKMITELGLAQVLVEKEGSYSLHNSPLFPTYYKKMKMRPMKKISLYSDEDEEKVMIKSKIYKHHIKNYRKKVIKMLLQLRQVRNEKILKGKKISFPTYVEISKILDIGDKTVQTYIKEIEQEELEKKSEVVVANEPVTN